MKDESEGKIIGEFVELKSKMYFMKNIDGKESNTDLEEFKAKNIKWEHTKSTKYHYLFLMTKDLF